MKKSAEKKHTSFITFFICTSCIFLFAAAVMSSSKTKYLEFSQPQDQVLSSQVLETSQVQRVEIEEITSKASPSPQVSARAYIVYDVIKDRVVAEKNSDMALPPASTTKIMTALVALDEYSVNSTVSVPKECLGLPGVNAYLRSSDTMTIESFLYALLLPSASDAACVLARANGDPYKFLAKMNKKAELLGLQHTNFDNVIGLDSDDDNHFSSASDLLILAKEAMKNNEFMKIVGTQKYYVPSYSTNLSYEVRNTNELLFTVPGTVGIKTGQTPKAGGCLVYAYQNKGKSVIIIVLGSDEGSRFSDTKALLDWYLEN